MKKPAFLLSIAVFVLLSCAASAETLLSSVREMPDVVYASPDGKDLHMAITLPAGAGPHPAVVWIHGGGWKQGSYRPNRAAFMAEAGFVAASIEYRLTDRAVFPAQIHDCKAAIRYLRANAAKYNLDPKRIGVWGGSAGGHLAALMGASCGSKALEGTLGNHRHSSCVQAVCSYYGPMDFNVDGWRPRVRRPGPLEALFGGPLSEKRELARLASPITHVSEDDPPFMLIHGTDDLLVTDKQSIAMAEALRKAGVPVDLKIVKGGNHGLTAKDQEMSLSEIHQMTLEFFRRKLGRASAAD